MKENKSGDANETFKSPIGDMMGWRGQLSRWLPGGTMNMMIDWPSLSTTRTL